YVDALSQTIADLVIGPSGLPVVPVVAVVDGLAHQPLYAAVVPGHDAGDAGSVRLTHFAAHAAGVHAVCHGGHQRTRGGALDQIDEAMATVVGVLRADAVCRHHRASVAIGVVFVACGDRGFAVDAANYRCDPAGIVV